MLLAGKEIPVVPINEYFLLFNIQHVGNEYLHIDTLVHFKIAVTRKLLLFKHLIQMINFTLV